MSDTTRLRLPLIAAQQAQKHVTHNEALLKLDMLVQATVLDRDLNTPPASPAEGDAYIVADGASGDWAGQEGNIAVWQNGGWVFHAPSEGWKVWVADEDVLCIHDGTDWIPFEGGGGISLNPVRDGKLGINTTADDTNRLAVKSDAVLFSHDDVTPGSGDVRFKVNKKAAGNTASLLFHDNWSGRAELGLTGDDDFHIKVSADGNAWHEAMTVSAGTGDVTFGGIVSGDGSGLTNVDAEKLGGTPASGYAKLTGATFTGGVTATGFTGDGGGLTNVNAAYLGGKSPSSYALLSGADFTGDVSANSFSGDGSGLTNVDADKLGGRPASDYALASDVPAATTKFTQLQDTPGSYSGQANKFIKVNAAGNALEFTDTKFTTLVDTPNSFAGQAGKVVRVNANANGLEFGPPGVQSVNPVPDGKLGINTTADDTNRLAVKSDAVLFSHDDVTPGSGDVRFKVNKAATTNTASLLFQDNWSGRAELGLTGDDDFHIKVSQDGNAWHEAMVVDSTSGWVRFPSGGVRELLRSHRTFYVSPAGNDGADGLSPGTALRTVQEAVRRCYRIDSNGFNVTIRLAPGVYEGNVVIDRRIVGGARLDIVGDATDPSSVILRNNVNFHTIRIIDGAKVGVYDLQIENTANWSLIFVDTGADLKYGNVVFTQCNRDHVEASANALVLATDDYTITGGGRSHVNFSKGCIFQAFNRVVTIRNTPHFSVAFAWFQRGSHYSVWNMTWSGAATGRRYYVRSNATCNGTAPDHFPGDVDGIADTGGYYGGA